MNRNHKCNIKQNYRVYSRSKVDSSGRVTLWQGDGNCVHLYMDIAVLLCKGKALQDKMYVIEQFIEYFFYPRKLVQN